MLRIFHFIGDKKYAGWIMPVFDKTENDTQSQFLFVGNKSYEFKSIVDASRIKIIEPENILEYLSIEKPDAVFLHGLDSFPVVLLSKVQKDIKVFWFAWGYDLYTPIAFKPFINIPLYGKLTKKAMDQGMVYKLRLLHGALHRFCRDSIIKAGIKRIDYFSGVYPIEGEMMKNLSFFKANLVTFKYVTLHTEINEENLNAPKSSGNCILVGNSGDPTNNHIDLYDQLYRMNVLNVDVYSFLSYGGNSVYRKKVIDYGKKCFGRFYHPITDFLPYEEYTKIVNKCNVVIMGHKRQQAAGNITAGLWNGCKVFVPVDSVACKHLTSKGFYFYKFPEDFSLDIINTPLRDGIVDKNRRLCLENSSLKVGIMHIRNIYKMIKANQ